MMSALRRFGSSTSGTATIEFVVVFLVFIGMIFFVIETTLYQFSVASLEKAAEAGVRAAVTSPPVAAGVPARIARSNNGVFGYKCSDASSPCVPFGTVSCTGTACSAAPFNRILAHMRGFNGRIAAQNVTVTYSDVGIGFAGGPAVPMVSVRIDNVPYENGIFGLLLADATGLAVLPRRAATMTGEDLGS